MPNRRQQIQKRRCDRCDAPPLTPIGVVTFRCLPADTSAGREWPKVLAAGPRQLGTRCDKVSAELRADATAPSVATSRWASSAVTVIGSAAPEHERDAPHEELAAGHERIAGGVDNAIQIGVVDEKIDPAHTRGKITEALAQAPARRGRHKNIPL